MTALDRALLFIGWGIVVAVVLTMLLPVTRLVYHPIEVQIIGDEVTLRREFPGDKFGFPRPVLSYVETVKPLTQAHNGGHPCEASGGPFRYTRADDVGRWSIDWAADCLSDPQGFVWSAYWRWHLGSVQFGAASKSRTVLRDPCQYRVSSSGTIHGPDSPHWAQVSRARCYPTRAQAEQSLRGDNARGE